ncbi:endonuclease/exonuclease/phosphatase family protein [Candidatus Spongiihabitans sp.]|uniref:endonuclease/exonuclease/phosphatase family protein n=1 Tax=Candidatus Spongiihabitans sp. TaxID=3101308 RepID=UPI003C7AC05D
MKIVTYNIQYGLGRDGQYDLKRTAKAVEGGDVIALQEVERFWKRSGNVDEVAVLAELLPDFHWVYAPGLDMDASYRNEHNRLINRRRQFGIMLMSRLPIISSRGFPLPKYGTLTQHSIQQSLLEAVIDMPAGPVRVYSAHLSHLSAETRGPQIEALLNIIDQAPTEGGAWCGGHPNPDAGWTEGEEPPMPRPAMLMGDLNFVPGSTQYDLIAGPLSPRHGRLVRRDGFLDAWVVAGHGENDRVTSPAVANAAEGGADTDTCLDYCFVTANLADRVRSIHIDGAADASDHQPVWIDMDLDDPTAPL